MNKRIVKLLGLLLIIFFSICSFFSFSYDVNASSYTKKTIEEKTTIHLSNRYNVVKKDYDQFLRDPMYYEYTIEDYAGKNFDDYYDSYENRWVYKPSIGEFFTDLWDSNLDCEWEDVYKSSRSIDFTTDGKMCFIVPLTIEVESMYDEDYGDDDEDEDGYPVEKGGVRITLCNGDGDVIQNDFINLKGYTPGDSYETWLYSDGGIQPSDDYTYSISSSITDTNYSVKVSYSIIGYTKYSQSAKMKKKASTPSGKWVKIGKLGLGAPLLKSTYISNKKVVPYLDFDENGNVYAYGKKKGSSTITIKLKNGKKYKTRVTVKAGEPNFEAYLTGYNTRNNYFTIKVYNSGASPVTFIRSGSRVIDKDYKKYDRYIKGGKNVTVKAGKTATIKFYVKGSNTWYKYNDFTLYTTMKYEGKAYPCHIWDEDSSYKKNKKWWTTYWVNN